MKKYLLTALLWVFGLVGFSNANFTFEGYWEWLDSWYTPSDIVFSDFDLDTSKVSFECSNWNCFLWFMTDSTLCRFFYNNWTLTIDDFDTDGCTDMNWEYWVTSDWDYNTFSSFTVCPNGCSSGWWNSDSSSQILSGWISQLSPVITSISSVMSEFIPYVVYIWIGILLVTLWFKAIKRLVNWLSSKITRYFK